MQAGRSTLSSGNPSRSTQGTNRRAKWNLDKTVVRAPADGYVTNVALRKGARVANLPLSPVMAFIDTSETLVGVEIQQIDARYIAPGSTGGADVQVHARENLCGQGGEPCCRPLSTGQTQTSGHRRRAAGNPGGPVRCSCEAGRQGLCEGPPAGSVGDAGDFHSARSRLPHVIRKVLLRQIAILNYVNPF